NRTTATVDSVYASLFADPDLGDAVDDYVGTDTTSGMAYTYNADNNDLAYGAAPPAVGFQVVSGPVGLPNGRDDDRDGAVDEPGERLGVTATSNLNGPEDGVGNGAEMYNRMRGVWNDGSPVREFRSGYHQTQGDTTTFIYPGDPVRGLMWSEVNSGNGVNSPGERQLSVHTGPFRLLPGESETVVFGVPFAQGTSNLDSVVRLRQVARTLRNAEGAGYFDPVRVGGFAPPEPVDIVGLGAPSPNPFTRRTTVRYQAPAGTPLRATLHDALGRLVATLHDGPTDAMTGTVEVDGRGLPAGTYFVHVRVPAGERTLALTLAR
ncbi:MAG TPA: T9SS type A sorting domain-containing protein, partial [Rubricoccaceae bacterium]